MIGTRSTSLNEACYVLSFLDASSFLLRDWDSDFFHLFLANQPHAFGSYLERQMWNDAYLPESYGSFKLLGLASETTANTIWLTPKPGQQDQVLPSTDKSQDDTLRLRCGLEFALVRREGEPSHFVASHGVLSTHHRSPLRSLRNPLVLPLPHPRKVITRSCPEIKTATAWNNSRVPLSVRICLSLLPEHPSRQGSRQYWKSTKSLCFHLRLFWLGPRLFL